MRNIIFRFLLAAALISCAESARAQDLLKTALAKIGRDSSNIGFSPRASWGLAAYKDEFRLPFFDELLASPLKIPLFSKDIVGRYNAYIDADSNAMGPYKRKEIRTLASLVMNSARNLGCEMGKYGWDYDPHPAAPDSLVAVIRQIYTARQWAWGRTVLYDLPTVPWSDREGEIRSQLKNVPPEIQEAIASILQAVVEAARLRDESLSRIPREQWEHIYASTTLEESQCDAHTFDKTVYDAALAFDLRSACLGGMKLAQVVEKAFPLLRKYPGGNFAVDIPTPLGRIVIDGSGDDVHYAQDCALLIDFDGDDTYYGRAGASSVDVPVSVLIDVRGDDRYINDHAGVPSQGAGVLGIGLLCDLAGNDEYRSRTFSQGCGRFGVGVLYDASGKDRYVCDGFSQGAGMYGAGILFDRSGDDEYRCVYYAQGYGFSRGIGLLADAAGDDRYIADDETLTHVGDETPLHNESDAQGYGAGRRADHTDGYSMSGGIGVLDDLAGNDTYYAGVFGQGTGYWYGYGILNDRSGNDSYRGVFFNLGSTAHFSIGVLFDDAGDDRTELVMTCGIGMAHDCSASFYIDGGGNDTYIVSRGDNGSTSLGSSLNNSFALFANVGGDDLYKSVGNSIAYATSGRRGIWSQYAPTTGIFIDIGGKDTYEYLPANNFGQGKENSIWIQPEKGDVPGVYAVGIDADSGWIGFER